MKEKFGRDEFNIIDNKSFTAAYGGKADFFTEGISKSIVSSITKTITSTRAITVATPSTKYA